MQYTIFTDGASRGNPGDGGYGAIVSDGETVREVGGHEDDTTNNRMEMLAVISALRHVSVGSDVTVFTDSAYVVNGITKWVHGWQKNNWHTKTKDEVMNKDLWMELVSAVSGKHIDWQRVSGHSGIPANERCDVIATSFADGMPMRLFHGSAQEYPVDLSVTVGTEKALQSKSNKKATAYSYVSMVGGKVQTHDTWAECEARVKGVSGARFKKSVSVEDEAEIIKEFSHT